jgi:hypothetical protein
LKRSTHIGPIPTLLYPARNPASPAVNPGSSRIAAITCARCTSRAGSFRDAASRRIAVSSSAVTVRKRIRLEGDQKTGFVVS